MHWHTWNDFLNMGGYALYVWGSFGVTFIVVAWELLALQQRRRLALKQIRQIQLLESTH